MLISGNSNISAGLEEALLIVVLPENLGLEGLLEK